MSIIKIANEEVEKNNERGTMQKLQESYLANTLGPAAAFTGLGSAMGANATKKLGVADPAALRSAAKGGALVGALSSLSYAPFGANITTWHRHNNQDIRQHGPSLDDQEIIQKSASSRGERYLDHELANHGEVRSRRSFVSDDEIHGGKAPVGVSALVGAGAGVAPGVLATKAGVNAGLPKGLAARQGLLRVGLPNTVIGAATGAALPWGLEKNHRNKVYKEMVNAQEAQE